MPRREAPSSRPPSLLQHQPRYRESTYGIFGSTNWHWSLPDDGSRAFVRSFGQKYGFPPSQAAHTCYRQAILYADACQRAGTFRRSSVGPALEGFTVDGLGNGPTGYRAEDHQCFKDVLVVKGKEVTVNAIAPGYIDTDMVRAVPETVPEKIIATIPVGRRGHASEIAKGVLFLVDDEMGFTTGSTLSINGGQHVY